MGLDLPLTRLLDFAGGAGRGPAGEGPPADGWTGRTLLL